LQIGGGALISHLQSTAAAPGLKLGSPMNTEHFATKPATPRHPKPIIGNPGMLRPYLRACKRNETNAARPLAVAREQPLAPGIV
jgi:hypothetical protein